MKKRLSIILAMTLAMATLAGCTSKTITVTESEAASIAESAQDQVASIAESAAGLADSIKESVAEAVENKDEAQSMAESIAAAAESVAGAAGGNISEISQSIAESAIAEVKKQKGETAAETTAAPLEMQDGAVNVAALKGPTAMGLVNFMDGVDSGAITDQKFNFQIAASADLVTPLLVQGKLDIATVPANLAAVLYNNTKGQIQVMAINTLGVIYIEENGDSVKSVADLKGKTIYASGKGSTPEYALNYILKGNGIDPEKDVTIEWKSEHTECLQALTSTKGAVAMLPQPFVTTAQMQSSDIHTVLDLTEEWDKLQQNEMDKSAMITGVVVGQKKFLEENPEAAASFLKHYEESVNAVNSDVKTASALIGKYGIVKAEVAEKALPECNIVYIAGADMEEKLAGYLAVLNDQNPKSIGGALPADDFYYIAK